MNILSTKQVKTRKLHTCHGCTQKINSGEVAEVTEGKYGGEFYRIYMCPRCLKILEKHGKEINAAFLHGYYEGELIEYYNDYIVR